MSSKTQTLFILIIVAFVIVACRENNPTDPPWQPPAETGQIVIFLQPDSLPVTWTLAGPDGFSYLGHGPESLSDRAPGDYVIHWGDEPCWLRSGADTTAAALVQGDTIIFRNTYTPQPGGCGKITVRYNFSPEDYNTVMVAWTLTGPGTFQMVGEGEQFLDLLPPGDYSIIWETPLGFQLVFSKDSTTVSLGSVSILDATFIPDYDQMGSLTITTFPEDLNIHWNLQGPGKTWSGSGDTTIEHVVPGEYNLTWAEVTGWTRQEDSPAQQFLEPSQSLSFTANYFSNEPLPVPEVMVRPGPETGQVLVTWQQLPSSLYPIASYLVATGTEGPITTSSWSQARMLAPVPSVPGQESYSVTYTTDHDDLVAGQSNWFAVRAMDTMAQLSPLAGTWSSIPTQTTTVSGRVQDQNGQPLAAIPVDLAPDGGEVIRTMTSQDGDFSFPAITNNSNFTLTTATFATSPGFWFDFTMPRVAGSPLADLVLPLIPRHEMDASCLLATPDFLSYLRAMTNTDGPTNNRPNTQLFKWDHWPLTVYLPPDNTPQEQDFQALSRTALDIWNDTMAETYFTESSDPGAADVVFVYSADHPTLNGQVSILLPAGNYFLGDVIPGKMEVYLNSSLNTDQRVTEVALHELGHTLGIADHSQCSGAGYLMYITSGGVLDNGPEHAIHPDEQELVTIIRHLPQGLDTAGFNPD